MGVVIISNWSFSKLGAFDTCPYSYYLNYVAVPKPQNDENAFNQYGSYVHEILEKYFKGELELFELLDYYDAHFDENVVLDFPPCSGRSGPIDLRKNYLQGGATFFEEFDGWPNYKVLGVEEKFKIDFIDGDTLTGIIDLILEDKNGEIIILDHKSKSGFKSKDELRHYGYQPALYALYIHEKYGKWPNRLAFNIFRKQEIIKLDFTLEFLEEAKNWAIQQITKIRECTDFTPKFDKNQKKNVMYFCQNICGFKEMCEYQYLYRDDNGEYAAYTGDK